MTNTEKNQIVTMWKDSWTINEDMSLQENASHLALPVLEKLKEAPSQLNNKHE